MSPLEAASAVSIPARPRAGGFARYAWAVLAYNVAVVLWGALVRVTGSGAGCGNHWPLCNGTVTPLSGTAATTLEFTHRIEFTHRMMSGLDAVLVVALVLWAFRLFPRRHPARLGAALAGVFLVTEVLLGAALVLLQHVGRNPSVNRAYSLSGHLVNTLALLACLALTAWWAGGKPPVRFAGPGAWMAAASLLAFAILGVSGVIAALGDTLFPAQSLAAGFAQDLDPAASIFLRLRIFHPLIAAAVEAWLVIFAVTSFLRRPAVKPMAWAVLAAAGVQLVAGFVNLVLLAPGWMQIVHLLLADTLWILLVLLCASLLAV
jgi:heme A synthase